MKIYEIFLTADETAAGTIGTAEVEVAQSACGTPAMTTSTTLAGIIRASIPTRKCSEVETWRRRTCFEGPEIFV
jgi:hypothetical protein